MKKFISLFMLAMASISVLAQQTSTQTIHGAVIDKNGNPLPGAVVSATGGAETTMVEADGTYSLEVPIWLKKVSASYPGYEKSTKKVKPGKDMIFKLNKDGGHGFLNVFGGFTISDAELGGAFGLMGGYLNKWGGYAKLGLQSYDSTCLFAIGGVIKSITNRIFAHVGIGYGGAGYWNSYYYEDDWDAGMAFDAGVIFQTGRHFNVGVGAAFVTNFAGDFTTIPQVSVGYVF